MQRAQKWLLLPAKMRWFEWFWLGLPIAVWFSYQPLIRLGQNETMYFELSIAVLYLAVVTVMSLLLIWQKRQELLQNRAVWLSGAFVLWSLITLLWTPNVLRGMLTCGIVGMLVATFWGMLARGDELCRMVNPLLRTYLAMTVAMSCVGLAQFFAGIWLDESTTLLCLGCQAMQFGFVRPNGFTIEPQFFGGLLALGALIFVQRVALKPANWRIWSALAFVLVALLLTLSRGAILSLAVGIVIITTIYWRQWRRIFKIFTIGLGSLIIALGLQGWAAVNNPTIDETFGGAVRKSIEQLTIGVIKLKIPEKTLPEQSALPLEEVVASSVPSPASEKSTPAFDGYVEESTNIRLALSELAVSTWSRDMPTQLFGAGVGGAGVAMNQTYPERIGSREIVQNQYVEILLELGAIGIGLFLGLIIITFRLMRAQPWLWSLLAACMIQWLFFSGYPNALHTYLLLIVMAGLHLSFCDQKSFAKS